jgi:hypothetical protein
MGKPFVAMFLHEVGEFRGGDAAPDEAAVQAGVGWVSHLGPSVQREGEQAQAIRMKLDGATVLRVSNPSLRHVFALTLEAFGHGVLLLMAKKCGIGR